MSGEARLKNGRYVKRDINGCLQAGYKKAVDSIGQHSCKSRVLLSECDDNNVNTHSYAQELRMSWLPK
jgi:hypothetical protein